MSEKRYIDKARLIKAIEDLPDCPNGFSDTFDKACIIGVIEELPTIAPKSGRWIHDGQRQRGGVDWMHCSECGNTDVFGAKSMYHYCPNCGARMDGEEDG